jgi:hypothetical protein
MRFATLIVEQFDRAATELVLDHPLNARMALILIDNAAELLIHRRCEHLVRADQRRGKPNLSSADRRSILGRFFGEKIKFLEKVAAISAAERHFIGELHTHRNALYHVGLKNDDIIRPLAVAYFRLTCALLIRLDNKTMGWGWPEEFVVAEALYPYFPDAAAGRQFPDYDSELVSKVLLARIPEDAPALEGALSAHSEASVEQVEGKFDSIELGLDRKSTAIETFRQVQRDADFQRIVREGMRKKGMEDQFIPFGHPVMNELAAKLMPAWKPRYKSLPFDKWRLRAKSIAKVPDPLSSIRKFTDLRSEMDYLSQAIDDAHETFWGWVQQQEDAAQDARNYGASALNIIV